MYLRDLLRSLVNGQRPGGTAVAEPSPAPSAIRRTGYAGRIEVDEPTVDFEPRPVAGGPQHQAYRPDTVLDGWSTEHFTIRAASVRGDDHRYGGAPRQDDMAVAVDQETGVLALAVADGVSNAPLSHAGASAVCRYAVAAVMETVRQGQALDWRNLFERCAWALVELARRQGDEKSDPVVAERLYATTLTVVFLRPAAAGTAELHTVSVGDSAVWLLRAGELARVGGGKTDDGDGPFSAVVTAMPRLPRRLAVLQELVRADDVVLVMTDGIGDPLGDGTGLVGDLLKGELRTPPAAVQFARVTDFSRGTFTDDRTLVGIWPSRPSAVSRAGRRGA